MKSTFGKIVFTCAAISVSLLYLEQANGNIIYTIDNNPPSFNNWQLSGTITTDGALGSIDASDIVNYTVTAQKGTYNHTFVYSSGRALTNSFLYTTQTSFGLDLTHAPSYLQLADNVPVSATDALTWSISDLQPGDHTDNFALSGLANYPYSIASESSSFIDANSTFEIASAQAPTVVPEPSSFALLGLGAIGLAIGAYRRRGTSAVGSIT